MTILNPNGLGHLTYASGKMCRSFFIVMVSMIVLSLNLTTGRAQSIGPQTDKLILNGNTMVSPNGYLGEKIQYSLEKRLLTLNLESILEPFRNRPGAHQWIGEHVGKFIHAAVLEYGHSRNEKLKERLQYAAKELMKTQLPDGYLGTYEESERWTSWDVWSHKYNMIGLLSYYDLTKNEQALTTCKKMAELLISTFGEGKRDIIASGTHVGMAPTSILEPMVKLYTITGEEEHLKFCEYLIQSWEQDNGPKILSSLLEHGNVHMTANNKAYEMLSNLVGLLDLYKVTGNKDYFLAVEKAWKDIVDKRLFIHGTTSYKEHFTDGYDLSPKGYYVWGTTFMGPGEGCVSTTWLQMNTRLLEQTGEQKYIQHIENTIYNAILPAQNPNNGEVCYFLPLNGRKRYGEVTHGILPDVSCCSSSIPRAIAMISKLTNGIMEDKPVLLLYAEGNFSTHFIRKDRKVPVEFKIRTDFPKSGNVRMTVTSNEDKLPSTSVLFRVPEWAKDFELAINGETYFGIPGTFLEVKRKWKNGDSLNIAMEMPIQMVRDNNQDSELVALKRGPQLLSLDQNITDFRRLPDRWKGNQLYKVSVVRGDEVSDLLFVPFADAGQSMADYQVLLPEFEIRTIAESP